MSRPSIREWPEVARHVDQDEIEPLAEIAERLSQGPTGPSSEVRSRLEARLAGLAPLTRWRPRNVPVAIRSAAATGGVLLIIAALSLAGIGPLQA